MEKPIPITRDGVILFGGDFCYSIEKGSDPFGPQDNVVARLPCGLNSKKQHLARYEGLGGSKIENYRVVSECYSTRELANKAKSYDTILIRFNNKWQDDPKGRKWRVIMNDVEQLASHVHVRVFCDSVEKPVNGEPKFHMLCKGKVTWENDEAWIWGED